MVKSENNLQALLVINVPKYFSILNYDSYIESVKTGISIDLHMAYWPISDITTQTNFAIKFTFTFLLSLVFRQDVLLSKSVKPQNILLYQKFHN